MKTVLLALLVGTSLSIASPVFAHGSEDHATSYISSELQDPSLQNSQAIMDLEEGFSFMEETISEKNIEEMFNGGPIMEAWHEKSIKIGEAIEYLDGYSQTLDKDQAARIIGVTERISEILNDFHIATHNKDKIAAEKEVTKGKSALKLLKVLILNNKKEEE